ncbi:nickel-responsive transcriptional regulator NikR [Mangrovibacterium diazotrophicum]|uniref:Putative nickel-responsive regulator n=1 Tax=Mangrovibacterium diazotrophicum TaxID=1261403 RepID=A0A419WA17_9BACT|nr:nickel-responsive transcriptional regulator NikR [Mangrovibacterium diazotrophicum]RKD92264.1 CopG family nickel-responsive transcriptional regulator [Mangrovibacterium diazotrophicum]
MAVSRFGVSLDEELLKALDEYVQENNFSNRSQAIRFLVEKNLVEKKWKCDNIVAGAITLVYNTKKKEIRSRIQDIQADNTEVILSSQLFHLNPENCMEIVAVKGPSSKLTELSDQLIAVKGIQHGKLIMSKVE